MRRAFEAINRAQQLKTFIEGQPLMCRDKFLDVLDEELEITKHNWELELAKHNLPFINDPSISVNWDTGVITKEVADAPVDESSNADDAAASSPDLQRDGESTEPRSDGEPESVEQR